LCTSTKPARGFKRSERGNRLEELLELKCVLPQISFGRSDQVKFCPSNPSVLPSDFTLSTRHPLGAATMQEVRGLKNSAKVGTRGNFHQTKTEFILSGIPASVMTVPGGSRRVSGASRGWFPTGFLWNPAFWIIRNSLVRLFGYYLLLPPHGCI
jgi:hypothetical protein